MPPLLVLKRIGKAFGAEPLFTGLDLVVEERERLGIIGANGSGKSTLLAIAAGALAPDEGERIARGEAVIAYVAQDREFAGGSVHDHLAAEVAQRPEHEIAACVATTLGRAGFPDPDQDASTLSGGWRKRLAICCALIRDPDLLLLDEPTNHLDLPGLLWLEDLVRGLRGACAFVSHDRWFLDRAASRILEIDPRYPEGSYTARGGYHDFLARRADYRAEREREHASLANRHRREQAWLARQPKARTTKNAARIRDAEELSRDLASVGRQAAGDRRAGIDFVASGRRTQDLLVAEGLRIERGGRLLAADLACRIGPGERIGILGGNGSGKSTLLQTLIGEREPSAGRVTPASELRIATFAQSRANLDRSTTLRRALSANGTTVHAGGREYHVNAWAQRFLFDPTQLEQPVADCSGGEQARLLIAQLMTRPADLLVLDEPTNDLDIPALEALEESLRAFPGGMLLVTHDRELLERVATSCIALDGDGHGTWHRVASYGQWEAALRRGEIGAEARTRAASEPSADSPIAERPQTLSYAERKELRNLEGRIEKAETEVATAAERMAMPAVATAARELETAMAEHRAAEARLEKLYARWAELAERDEA